MSNDKVLESKIVREIGDYLNQTGLFFWRNNNIPVYGKSNDGKYRFRAMPKYARKGIPDYILIRDGKFIGIEVKRPGGSIRPEQVQFGKDLIASGGEYYVVDSVHRVQNVLHT